ncbi:hypothetical protein DRN73_02960 [Candidatus Pacearchaeota archaeon]|nr:MAG: hypothetical protein DRN73_02960 [Candidatus Pacearchaeota archaeon]
MKNKKAAMELTMGTLVTIVLLVMVLILGGYFVNKIFFSARGTIDQIDASVKSEVSKLFSSDETKKIVFYPGSRRYEFKKGEKGQGFAFSIRNLGEQAGTFTYNISAIETSCPNSLSLSQANNLISLGKTGSVSIPAGDIMEDPKLVTFDIPGTAPPCQISYGITIYKEGELYSSSVDFNVVIKPK